MGTLRQILMRRRALAALLIAAALAMKALVPAGFMPEVSARSFTVLVCADATGDSRAREVTVPGKPAKPGAQAHEACPFGGLGQAAMGGADPLLLALAIGFILAMGVRAAPVLRLKRRRHAQPPACGPPLLS